MTDLTICDQAWSQTAGGVTVGRDYAQQQGRSGVTVGCDAAAMVAPGTVTVGCDKAPVTTSGIVTPAQSRGLVLSLFPGIDLLGMGFERAGYGVVRGPDLIFGGDIRTFHVSAGVFVGVIGGSPCQDFSQARRAAATGYGVEMLAEFARVVGEAQPVWWLLENVPAAPDVRIDGYSWQRLDLRASEFGLRQRRLRHFQFGDVTHRGLVIARAVTVEATEPCCMASEGEKAIGRRPWADFCELQGLPREFDLPSFTTAAKYRAVGNGVPLPMAAAVASAIADRVLGVTPCACSCGRAVTGHAVYAGVACRKRAQRRREADVSRG